MIKNYLNTLKSNIGEDLMDCFASSSWKSFDELTVSRVFIEIVELL